MLRLKKHTIIQLGFYGVLVLICIAGTSLSIRRQQALATNLYDTCLQATQAFHLVAATEDGPQPSVHTLSVSPNDDGHVTSRQKVKFKLPPATLPAEVVAQIHHHVAHTSLSKAIRSLNILRPAYYLFLFRYTLF